MTSSPGTWGATRGSAGPSAPLAGPRIGLTQIKNVQGSYVSACMRARAGQTEGQRRRFPLPPSWPAGRSPPGLAACLAGCLRGWLGSLFCSYRAWGHQPRLLALAMTQPTPSSPEADRARMGAGVGGGSTRGCPQCPPHLRICPLSRCQRTPPPWLLRQRQLRHLPLRPCPPPPGLTEGHSPWRLCFCWASLCAPGPPSTCLQLHRGALRPAFPGLPVEVVLGGAQGLLGSPCAPPSWPVALPAPPRLSVLWPLATSSPSPSPLACSGLLPPRPLCLHAPQLASPRTPHLSSPACGCSPSPPPPHCLATLGTTRPPLAFSPIDLSVLLPCHPLISRILRLSVRLSVCLGLCLLSVSLPFPVITISSHTAVQSQALPRLPPSPPPPSFFLSFQRGGRALCSLLLPLPLPSPANQRLRYLINPLVLGSRGRSGEAGEGGWRLRCPGKGGLGCAEPQPASWHRHSLLPGCRTGRAALTPCRWPERSPSGLHLSLPSSTVDGPSQEPQTPPAARSF